MPKKDGLQVAEEILKANPKQRIIFASAYVKEILQASLGDLKRTVKIIQKPFSIAVFLETIEREDDATHLLAEETLSAEKRFLVVIS